MAAYSHSTSSSVSSLPTSSLPSSSRQIPVEAVPWVIYEYYAPDPTQTTNSTTRTNSRTPTTVTSTSSTSSSQKVRVVGRGGFGSRPRRSKSVSFSDVKSHNSNNDATPTPVPPIISRKPLPATPDDKPIVRVVGRGGAGSRPRNISNATHKSADSVHSTTRSSPEVVGKPVLVGGGRGGAGSRPRAFKQKEKETHGNSNPKWFQKGKAKMLQVSALSSTRYSGRPTSPVGSVDTGSVVFAPISGPATPGRLVNTAIPSTAPSERSIYSSSVTSTPSATYASTASSSDLSSAVRSRKSLKRLSKLYRTLGERFTDDAAFLAIKPPVIQPSSSRATSQPFDAAQDDGVSLRSSSRLSMLTFIPGDDDLSIRARQRQSTGLSSHRPSSLVDAFIDDQFESASYVSASGSRSPMTFYEPPMKTGTAPTVPAEPQSEGTYVITYRYSPSVPETPFSHYQDEEPDVPRSPSPDHLQTLSTEPPRNWSGRWNSDMKHVIDSLRSLR